jgi:tRNA A-37 threonylcarbamoyl transferase component Bud32
LSASAPSGVAFPAARPDAAARGPVWLVAVLAVAYVGYVGLLLCSDLLRVAPVGFVAHFDARGMTAASVLAGSDAARAGLRTGDRITRANGQTIEGRLDWQRACVHIEPSHPLDLVVDRAGTAAMISVPLKAGLQESLAGSPRPGLLAFRFSQLITLALAIVVAARRAAQPSALLGAWLLASIATVSIVLPMRLATFWDALPFVVRVLIWVPFAASMAVGPLLFAFFAVFPHRTWSRTKLGIAMIPAAVLVAWHIFSGYHVLSPPGAATGVPDPLPLVLLVNIAYAGGAVLMLMAHGRSAETLTDRRRIRVLMVGTVVGVTAGAGAVIGYWFQAGADIFATRTLAVLSLVFLAVPASFAYAILRHRLFDLSLIVRQGVRYALARRLLDGLIPVLGALLVLDLLLLHRHQSLLATLQTRWWLYALIGAALVLARSRREHWLRDLDGRFFRERYDAQRLLRNIAQQISSARSFDAVVPSVAQQLDQALHPEFVDVLTHVPAKGVFASVAAAEHRDSEPLPASLTVIGLLSVLGKPLALSLGDTAWVSRQLPAAERELLVHRGIELLVPITSQASGSSPAALVALGPRRSEEPYSEEDVDLLATIAHALGLLLDRAPGDRDTNGLAECESCGRCFDSAVEECTEDHARLSRVRGARRLNGRYRLDRRLGRGGMGAVYAASDEALERTVAVKLIRDDLLASVDLTERFRREARAAAAFTHLHVVRVYDFGLDREGRAFLVMELLEGQTLRERLNVGGMLSPDEALHVLRGICPAVSAAHAQGLVHRDLKPENVFLQRQETGIVPKVLDFGLAKAFGPQWAAQQTHASSAGLLIGTLEYMAPEQVAGDTVSPAWDIWALGVIAYEMLTRSHPFRRQVSFGDCEAAEGDRLGALAAPVHLHLPEPAAAFFRRALSSERDQRPPDALTFLRDLELGLR